MTQDTRKDRRVKIHILSVRYKSATVDEFIEHHAHDVSRGGIYIKTADPFPPGTLLKFEIRLASDQAVIAGVGRVVWKRDAGASSSVRPAGMGVKFIKIDEPSKAVIDRLVNVRTDAGISFESSDGTEMGDPPSDRPAAARTTPPPKRASGSPPPEARGSGARAISSSPGALAEKGAEKGADPPGQSLARPPLTRKATMIGLGSSSTPPAAGVRPGSSSPPRPTTGSAPPGPPRPAAKMAMFPKADPDWEDPPKDEQTVMRQAAELLEDALREAGGSMEEVGTNPLFSGASGAFGTAPRPSSSMKAKPTPVPAVGADTAVDAPRSTEAVASTHKTEPKKTEPKKTEPKKTEPKKTEPKKTEPKKTEPKKTEPQKSEDKASVSQKARPDAAPAQTGTSGKGGSAAVPAPSAGASSAKNGLARRVGVGVLAAAAVVVAIFMFREQLFGQGAASESLPSAAGTTTASAEGPTTPPPVTAPTQTAVTPPVPSGEPPTASSAAIPAASTGSAMAARGDGSAVPIANAPTPAPRAAPRPAPPRPSPPPAIETATTSDKTTTDKTTTEKTATDKTTTEKTATDKTATDKATTDQTPADKTTADKSGQPAESAPATAPSSSAKLATPAAKPKPTKPADDNPY
jgi:uncharacterized protein (TIGR02266 family)